ncbi:MAG: hypothetical protein J6N98_05455 [Prevotella sp.]|jgi:uncharacterized membrane protein|nr:hypothetical protein [Prevotella sp.]
MKQLLITLTMLLVLGLTTEAVAQKHRHTPQPQQTELVDSTSKNGVEAFSDTTSTASTPTAADDNFPFDDEDDYVVTTNLDRFFDHFGVMQTGLAGMFFVLIVLLIIFVLSPLLIIIAVFYFVNKNRKDKMRLAQMAMQQGQPIPDQLLKEQSPVGDEEYKSGLRQCFVGVGLMIFLWFAAGEVGFGIGALVFCIGLGKVIVAKSTASKNNFDMTHENKDNF